MRHIQIAALCLPLLVIALPAQQPQAETHAVDGGTHETITSVFIPELKNVPFSATVRTEWVKRLPDSTRITVKNHRLVARNAEGRIFQERRYFLPDGDIKLPPLSNLQYYDPTVSTFWDCNPNHACREFARRWPNTPGQAYDQRGSLATESLGARTIEGFDVTGTRETITFRAGVLGNDQPIRIVNEIWYSPALQMNLLTVRDDPRFGTQTFTVTDIGTDVPDPKLFTLPADARIIKSVTEKAEPPE